MQPSLVSALQRNVDTCPDRPALITPDAHRGVRRLSWRQLGEAVDQVADRLPRHSSGPFVVHRCDNRLIDVLIYLACLKTGRVDVPLDARLPRAVIRQLRRRIRSASLPRHSDAAIVLWTSGTTRSPRGVVLSHTALSINAECKRTAVPQTAADVRLTVLPIAHAYARTCDLGTWLLSAYTLAIARGLAGWKRMAPEVRPTHINVVPALASRLLADDVSAEGWRRLRVLGCGGAGLDQQTYDGWTRRGVGVIPGYGLTETAPVIASATPENTKWGLVGRIADGWETKWVGRRLYVRGPCLMDGYLDEPDAGDHACADHASASTGIDAEGWLDTGDLAEVDDVTGQLRILGRANNVLVLANGYQVHPESVERVLLQDLAIKQAMVVDEDGRLHAWLFGGECPSDDALRSAVRSLSAAQQPAEYFHWKQELTPERGELTAKRTLCREVIIANRMNESGKHRLSLDHKL